MKILILGDNYERCKYYQAILNLMNIPYGRALDGDFSEYTHLLVPGGIDVDPAYYGEEKDPSVKTMDHEFDEKQFAAVDYFVKAKKPILGICRGHQLINVYFGGSLYQDIPGHTKPEYADQYHMIENKEGFVKELYGDTCKVNSTHHQSIKKLGKGLKAISFAPDGTIEACVHEELPIIMVQFHPERLAIGIYEEKCIEGRDIFNYFINMH